jgi:hypothetical protein
LGGDESSKYHMENTREYLHAECTKEEWKSVTKSSTAWTCISGNVWTTFNSVYVTRWNQMNVRIFKWTLIHQCWEHSQYPWLDQD